MRVSRLYSEAILLAATIGLSPALAAAQTGQVPPSMSKELIPYYHARTVVDFSIGELLQLIPELKQLEFATSQESLAPILGRVGENVEAFFRDYPNTSALEDVYQEREEPGGIQDPYLRRKFRYIISASSSDDEIGLEEYRTDLKNERLSFQELKGAYLLTSGHAAAPLYFHPKLSAGCRFRYLGRDTKAPEAHVIAFAQDPEKARAWGTIRLLGDEAAILQQGAVWVDPATAQILRMRLELLASRSDMGLEQHTTIVELNEVRFERLARSLWLPREVQLSIRFKGWKFKNRHRYSQYQLFSVSTIDGAKQVLPKP